MQPCGTPQDKKKTMIGTVVTIICTHLHSSVRRSQVQFVGLHSWGGSFLSQNKRASVTSLVFSIQQRTIVTDQELHNNTLPPQHKKKRSHVERISLKTFKRTLLNTNTLDWLDLPKNYQRTINGVYVVIVTGCHTFIFYRFESLYLVFPIIPILSWRKKRKQINT